jgi:hypothetical protein
MRAESMRVHKLGVLAPVVFVATSWCNQLPLRCARANGEGSLEPGCLPRNCGVLLLSVAEATGTTRADIATGKRACQAGISNDIAASAKLCHLCEPAGSSQPRALLIFP